MELTDINVNSYPNSEKIYVDGSIYPIKVGMRRIKLTPTVKIVNGEKVMTENAPVVVNDTSGVYTDPNVEVDINKGIPRLREKWIEQRADTALQDGISSEYGRQRLADASLTISDSPCATTRAWRCRASKSRRWLTQKPVW